MTATHESDYARRDSERLTHASMMVIMEDPDADSVERVNVEGTEYLKAPVIAVQEMVLNGEFLPAEEIEPEVWDNTPLPVGHPKENGQPVPFAESDERSLGYLTNTRMVGDKLRGDLMIDIEKAEELADNVSPKYISPVERLTNGGELEVSTAYLREKVDNTGTYEGVSYNAVQRNLRPDHLALLPNDIGACSWEDGCGAPRQNCGCEYSNNYEIMTESPEIDKGRVAGVLEQVTNLLQDFRGTPEGDSPSDGVDDVDDSVENADSDDDSCGCESDSDVCACDTDISDSYKSEESNTPTEEEQTENEDLEIDMNEDELRNLIEEVMTENADEESAEAEVDSEEEVEANSEAEEEEAEVEANEETEGFDKDSIRDIIREEVQNAKEESEKSDLVEEVAANSSFDSEELQDMDVERLNKLRREVAGPRSDFAGRGAPSTNTADEDSDFPIPVYNARKKQTEGE